ncbi:MAG: alpha/beta fold hydrolase, partial [Angustibacter sp.]
MKSPPRAALSVGAGLAAAAVGAGLGLAAERWSANRAAAVEPPADYGSLRGLPMDVSSDDGTRIYAEIDDLTDPVAGVSGLTVIFSHGFCLTQDIWHFQRQWLRGRYRTVLWDQRGHG